MTPITIITNLDKQFKNIIINRKRLLHFDALKFVLFRALLLGGEGFVALSLVAFWEFEVGELDSPPVSELPKKFVCKRKPTKIH